MDVSRLGKGEQMVGLGGLVFAISAIFLSWFSFGPVDATGFEAADFLRDLVYLLTILVAVGLPVAKATARNVNLPVAASALTAALGGLTTLLVLIRIVDPGFEGVEREFGLFVGLLGAALIAYGGWTSMQEEGTTFSAEADRLQDRLQDDDRPGGGGAGGGTSSGGGGGGTGSGGGGGTGSGGGTSSS